MPLANCVLFYHMHVHEHTHTQTYTYKHTRKHTNTNIHTQTHTCTLTHTQTHTHTAPPLYHSYLPTSLASKGWNFVNSNHHVLLASASPGVLYHRVPPSKQCQLSE